MRKRRGGRITTTDGSVNLPEHIPASPTPDDDAGAPPPDAGAAFAPEPTEEQWAEEVAQVEAEAARAPRPKWGRWAVIAALLTVAVYFLLPQLASIRESAGVVRTLRPWAVVLGVVSETLSYVALGFMMKRIVGLTGQLLTTRRAFGVTLAAGSVGLVAGGLAGTGGSSYRWLREAGIRPEGALLAGWLPPLLNAGSVASFALAGMGVILLRGRMAPAGWVAVGASFALLVSVAAALFWATRHREGAKRIAGRLQARFARLFRRPAPDPEALAATLDRLYDAFGVLKRRGWRGPVIGSALGVTFDMGALYFLFVAAHHPLTPGPLLAGYALPMLVGKVAVVPGGLGVVEATMVALYTGFGVPASTAVTTVLAYRAIALWLPNLVGFGVIPLLQIPTQRSGADLPLRR
jgi:glycosyltransferase 2 family protein